MQVTLNEKETQEWLDKKVKERSQSAEKALDAIRNAVQRNHGCHHDGTRINCLGCAIYEGRDQPELGRRRLCNLRPKHPGE
jgi:hypothetical protein